MIAHVTVSSHRPFTRVNITQMYLVVERACECAEGSGAWTVVTAVGRGPWISQSNVPLLAAAAEETG